MKIQINEIVLDNVLLVNEEKTVLLRTEATDLTPLLNEIVGSVTIHQLDDDDTILWSIEGSFKTPYIVRREKYTTMYCPKVIAETPNIQQQITDLELALCEIYENMEV